MRIVLGTIIALLTITIPSGAAVFTSTFEDGTTEGWTIFTLGLGTPGGTGPTNVASGGVSNSRYLETEDTADRYLFFQSPPSWSGDFLNGAISFYLRNENPLNNRDAGYMGDPVLRVTGAGPTLYYYYAPGASTNWVSNYIPLFYGPNWSVTSTATPGTAPTLAEFNNTLSNVTSIAILGDWVQGYYGKPNFPDYGHDITGLDEVNLLPSPEPGTCLQLAAGLLGLLAVRTRRAR
jgi:hypothetical protein